MSGLSHQPRILHGAFVEYGFSVPPLTVAFQFNPETITRDKSNSISSSAGEQGDILKGQKKEKDLTKVEEKLVVTVAPEIISFDIRLDATDKLNEGDAIAQQFGIAPQISTLELMMYPKEKSLVGQLLRKLDEGFSFTGGEKPPIILFVWGRKKVLPVYLTSMQIKEEEFSPSLNPIRATISVNMMVIEGKNPPYFYSQAMKETMATMNVTSIPNIADVFIPK